MKKHNSKKTCRTPTPGKKPTNIDSWKYDVIRSAILNILPDEGEGVLFKDLPALVAATLPADIKSELGSINWYVTTVKLELETSGEIKRVPGSGLQRLIR